MPGTPDTSCAVGGQSYAGAVNPSQQDLQDAGCWFDADKAGGAEMTNFKREARWRQHRWAVDELSIASFDSHAGRRTDPDVEPERIPNGTKLLERDAAAGSNFLNDAIFAIANERVAQKQEHETLDATRLRRDLLSSMPMAFNLFGEASLPANAVSRDALAELLGAPAAKTSDLVFEWSPGRRDPGYTRDRTAFDVALRLGEPGSVQTVVGIETKYHEHSAKESKPSAAAAENYRRQTEFLEAIAEESGVFKAGWQRAVLDTDLRQIWRDHLLALSMRQNPRWTSDTRYVLLYPRRNTSFRAAAKAYAEVLAKGDVSFQALTIEDVLDAAFAHGGQTKDLFVRRYLW